VNVSDDALASDAAGATDVVGLVLAAGAGTRIGRPKALLTGPDGVTWLERAVQVLTAGGCKTTYAVLGASAEEVRRSAPAQTRLVTADDWAEGMGASLRAGLAAVAAGSPDAAAVVVMLVDTPGVSPEVVGRLIRAAAMPPAETTPSLYRQLIRCSYSGVPGHPVLIGRQHWSGAAESARGDRGARDYLRACSVQLVECGDIGTGGDIDTTDALRAWVGE
jgi:CTP:molybdopterin cytidylyltransferase MocA